MVENLSEAKHHTHMWGYKGTVFLKRTSEDDKDKSLMKKKYL